MCPVWHHSAGVLALGCNPTLSEKVTLGRLALGAVHPVERAVCLVLGLDVLFTCSGSVRKSQIGASISLVRLLFLPQTCLLVGVQALKVHVLQNLCAGL